MKNIVLLHGAIGAADQLIPLAAELEKVGFNCFTMDFSGHGSKDFSNGFGITVFARELHDFIEINNLSKPHVFGYSMGGYVALYLAAQHKDVLSNIITLGTKFAWSPEIAEKEIKMLDANTITEKVPKFAEALQKRHGSKWKAMLTRTSEMMLDLGNNNLLNKSSFEKIQSKTAIGLADNDTMVSKEETDFAASQIKNSVRFTMQNSKHPIETVDVKALADLIKKFTD